MERIIHRRITKSLAFFLSAILLFSVYSCNKRSGKPRLLVFSKTAAFYHESIPTGNTALIKLASENGYDIDTTTNADWFNEDTLRKYSAVIFLSTTGDVLNHYQEAAFERYIQAGGGFVGIHAASDTEYDWGWFGRLVGGYFKGIRTRRKPPFMWWIPCIPPQRGFRLALIIMMNGIISKT